MSLDSLVPVFLDGARSNFFKYGYLMPVLFTFTDRVNVIGVPLQAPEDKDALEDFLLDLIRSNSVKEFLFICESWISHDSNVALKHLAEHGSLEHCPNREEALVAIHSRPHIETVYKSAISRQGNEVSLNEWTEENQKTNPATLLNQRFGALWERAKAGSN